MANKAETLGIGLFLVLCMAYQVYGQVNCATTGAGRYANPTDTTCKNYTYCVAAANGTVLSYNYVCPGTSIFNANTGLCTAPGNYVCNVTPTTTNTVCTQDGFIADPNVTDCSSYVECVGVNGAFIQTTYTCPTNTFYNPTTTFCDANYVCPAFVCAAVGRFSNAADATCQTYYYCVLNADGITFSQFLYTCPSTSVFSPVSRLCTTTYTCPTAG